MGNGLTSEGSFACKFFHAPTKREGVVILQPTPPGFSQFNAFPLSSTASFSGLFLILTPTLFNIFTTDLTPQANQLVKPLEILQVCPLACRRGEFCIFQTWHRSGTLMSYLHEVDKPVISVLGFLHPETKQATLNWIWNDLMWNISVISAISYCLPSPRFF